MRSSSSGIAHGKRTITSSSSRGRILRTEYSLRDVLRLYRRICQGERVEDDETNRLIDTLRLSGIVPASKISAWWSGTGFIIAFSTISGSPRICRPIGRPTRTPSPFWLSVSLVPTPATSTWRTVLPMS